MVATAKGGRRKGDAVDLHRRLGHPSFETVVELAESGASGIVITDLPEKIPGRVHIDIAGPMQVKSAGGKEYEYIVVDDYTRVVYARPLRLKSEAQEVFKVFKAVAENESQKRMHEILTDNMGEMKDTCEQEGIKLYMSVRYCPESNGVAERTIGVLTNAARAMLHDSGLPKSLGAEAFNTATYIHNRTPTKGLCGRTPFEVLCEAKSDVSHLPARRAPSSSRQND